MILADIVKHLGLEVYTPRSPMKRRVLRGYTGDLLSDVIAHAGKADLWITIQVHPNIVAVAVLKELAAVVIANGREPAPETVEQAAQEKIPLLGSRLSAFEIAGRLYERGVKGR
jgi:serine kinase of HPr protein (carbohydrate metabolism regulator)